MRGSKILALGAALALSNPAEAEDVTLQEVREACFPDAASPTVAEVRKRRDQVASVLMSTELDESSIQAEVKRRNAESEKSRAATINSAGVTVTRIKKGLDELMNMSFDEGMDQSWLTKLDSYRSEIESTTARLIAVDGKAQVSFEQVQAERRDLLTASFGCQFGNTSVDSSVEKAPEFQDMQLTEELSQEEMIARYDATMLEMDKLMLYLADLKKRSGI